MFIFLLVKRKILYKVQNDVHLLSIIIYVILYILLTYLKKNHYSIRIIDIENIYIFN